MRVGDEPGPGRAMSLKFTHLWKAAVTSKFELAEAIDKLRRDNERLRQRLSIQQHKAAVAEKQATELREQKDRLKVKVSSLKKDLSLQRRLLEQAQDKNSQLADALRAATEGGSGAAPGSNLEMG